VRPAGRFRQRRAPSVVAHAAASSEHGTRSEVAWVKAPLAAAPMAWPPAHARLASPKARPWLSPRWCPRSPGPTRARRARHKEGPGDDGSRGAKPAKAQWCKDIHHAERHARQHGQPHSRAGLPIAQGRPCRPESLRCRCPRFRHESGNEYQRTPGYRGGGKRRSSPRPVGHRPHQRAKQRAHDRRAEAIPRNSPRRCGGASVASHALPADQ
jgi:hypothetical protein